MANGKHTEAVRAALGAAAQDERTMVVIPGKRGSVLLAWSGGVPIIRADDHAAGQELFAALAEVIGIELDLYSEHAWAQRQRSIALGPARWLRVSVSGTPGQFGDVVTITVRPGTGRIGLAAMRGQPWQIGHLDLVERMKTACDVAIIALGSGQLHGVIGHPLSATDRMESGRKIFGDDVRFLPVVDIGTNVDTGDWADYLLSKVSKQNLPTPTDYYTGSIADARWYVRHFADLSDPVIHRNGRETVYESPVTGRRLHLVDRGQELVVEATEVRSLIERRDPLWRQFVPAEIHDFIERRYPPELRFPVKCVGAFPEGLPPGTVARRTDEDTDGWYKLADDGHWVRTKPPSATPPAKPRKSGSRK